MADDPELESDRQAKSASAARATSFIEKYRDPDAHCPRNRFPNHALTEGSTNQCEGKHSPNDLVNLLKIPGSAERRCTSWLVIFPPLNAIFHWIKDFFWIFSKPISWSYPTQSHNKILNSETLFMAYEKAARQQQPLQDAEIEEEEEERAVVDDYSEYKLEAKEMLVEMSSHPSPYLFRSAATVVTYIFRNNFSGLHARRCQLADLRTIERKRPNVPIIYLPLHRSHLDYILITYILYFNSMRVPQVAAGDNLNIPVFGRLLRGLGGFFIRRKIDQTKLREKKGGKDKKDFVYRGVLQQFICEVLSQGYPLEFYLEGGRSRNGRTLPAKAGILSVLIHAYQKGFIEDAIIVPVAFSYDKPIEGNFVDEMTGAQKTKESFGHALRSIWKMLTSFFGTISVEFGQCFSLREFLLENAEKFGLNPNEIFGHSGCLSNLEESLSLRTSSSSASLISVLPADDNSMNKMASYLATEILHEASHSLALTAPNVVFFLMNTSFREGCSEDELVSAMSSLCKDLTGFRKRKRLAFDAIDEQHLRDYCRYTVSIFPHLITFENNIYTIDQTLEKCIERHYYCGPVMESLIGESLIAACIHVEFLKQGSRFHDQDQELSLKWEATKKKCVKLATILKYEFIHLQPSENCNAVLDAAKLNLVRWQVLTETFEDNPADARIHIRQDKNILQKLSSLTASISPLIEGYIAVADNLPFLLNPAINLCERCLQYELLHELQFRVSKGLVEYPEGCAKDTILNSLKLFQSSGILESKAKVLGRPSFHLQDPQPQEKIKCEAVKCKARSSKIAVQISKITETGVAKLGILRTFLATFNAPLLNH